MEIVTEVSGQAAIVRIILSRMRKHCRMLRNLFMYGAKSQRTRAQKKSEIENAQAKIERFLITNNKPNGVTTEGD